MTWLRLAEAGGVTRIESHTGHDMHVSIRIKGHLDPSWQQGLEGLQIFREENGTSRLSGVLKDQATLFGVLKRIDHLNLPLLSLESSERPQNEGFSPL